MRFTRLLLSASLLALAGCGDSNPTPDAAADTAAEAAADAAPDAAQDAAVADATPDVAVTDATPDVTPDAVADAPADAARDAAADATADVALDAVADAARDAAADASASCGASTCMPTEICLRQRTLGGVFIPPDDGGTCPAGRHPEGGACVADFSYRCVARPTCATADCACLGTLCPSSFMCRGAEASLLTCEQLAP